MKDDYTISRYSPAEEMVNVISHGLGALLGIAGTSLMVTFASLRGNAWHIVSFAIFGSSMVILFAASTAYHASRKPDLRRRLKVVDHAAIYVLIAGTYTPFTFVTLQGAVGWVIFGITWGLALAGIILKLFFTGRFNIVSTAMYVAMGWLIVFFIKPLVHNLPFEGLMWLVAGGVSYTVGAVLYSIKKIPFNHALFHLFVLGGAFCHFWAVFFYVL